MIFIHPGGAGDCKWFRQYAAFKNGFHSLVRVAS